MTLRPTIFVNRRSDGNAGDIASSPLQYFRKDFPRSFGVEVHLRSRLSNKRMQLLREHANAIIIGGGGLLLEPSFQHDVANWGRASVPVILWGVGLNRHNPAGHQDSQIRYEDYYQLSGAALIGIRDYGTGFNWVPCASCMHPLLADGTADTDGGHTAILLHRDSRNDPDFLDRVTRQADNFKLLYNDLPIDRIIGELRDARMVVTNSYHAAYWASLLGKPVVSIGGGIKMRTLKHAPTFASAENWAPAAKDAVVHPGALDECREANVAFKNRVKALVDQPRDRNVFYRVPIEERAEDLRQQGRTAPAIMKSKVPKVVHFVFGLSPDFGGKPFNLMHKIAVLSAHEVIKPDQIIFHHEYLPDNAYFNDVKHLLHLNPIKAPDRHGDIPIKHFAHKADIVRMQTLQQYGGIYLDLDTISVRSFDSLLPYSFTIGLQGRERVGGLCNAVMLAAPGDAFVNDWLDAYKRFTPGWDQFSVRLPYAMWRSGNWSINIQEFDRFHWPTWERSGLKMMFEEDHEFDRAYCHHLWESFSLRYFGQGDKDEAEHAVRNARTSYARLARKYL